MNYFSFSEYYFRSYILPGTFHEFAVESQIKIPLASRGTHSVHVRLFSLPGSIIMV